MRPLPLFLILTVSLSAAGCSSVERARPRPQASSTVRDIDGMQTESIMRGTVGAETMVVGWNDVNSPAYQPIQAQGYGLVVGLDGTGSRDVPPDVRAHMLQVMNRGGVGSEKLGYGNMSPEAMLDSPDTAVVIVQGVIPPGAVGRQRTPPSANGRFPQVIPGTPFDIRVYADPRTGTTSLEGGRLYTTDLFPGPLMVGGRSARRLAQAAGPIFLNPFITDENNITVDLNLQQGRILNGGQVLEDIPIKLQLVNPSYTRIRVIQNAINRRFPIERGQSSNTAHGVSDAVIELTIPPSMRDEPDTFMNIVRHTTLRQVDSDRISNSIRRTLQRNPADAPAAYWRWVALGPQALPMVRKMYDYPESTPRLAALRAGAALEDAVAAEPLRKMALKGTLAERLEAATLLPSLPPDPRTEDTLRQMLNDEHIEVRLRAYEGLELLGSPMIRRSLVPGRFELHEAPSDYAAIYITQAKAPRVVILGNAIEVDRPMTLGLWDNTLLMKESPDGDEIEVYHRPGGWGPAEVNRIHPELRDLILMLSHQPSVEDPAPGLGLTYSQIVGVLHQLWKQQFIAADFKAQQDRVLADLRRASVGIEYQPRAE